MSKIHFSRREIMKMGVFAGIAGVIPTFLPSQLMAATAATSSLDWTKTLLMIKLDGGNDGLNTIIPQNEPNYSLKTRPNLYSVTQNQIHINQTAPVAPLVSGSQVSPHFAFNNNLIPLMGSSGTGPANIPSDMLIALGIGYPGNEAMGSHFYSSDAWGTASTATNQPNYGWITSLIGQTGNTGGPVDAAMIGGGGAEAIGGIYSATGASLIHTAYNPGGTTQGYTETARDAETGNSVYSWLFQQQALLDNMATKIDNVSKIALKNTFPTTALGANLAKVAQIIINGQNNPLQHIPVLSLYHNQPHSFDTHVNQLALQAPLLEDLATSLAVFRKEMVDQDLWNDVLVMTHAEFGRGLFENDALGTDHGKANCHFILGGKVAGGKFIGAAPDLNYAYNNPLNSITVSPFVKGGFGMQAPDATTDFREIYSTIIQDWWKGSSSLTKNVLGASYNPLPILEA